MKKKQYFKSTVLVKNSFVLLAFIIFMGCTGCKDKKKVVDNPDPKDDVVKVDENLVKAKSTLESLLSDNSKSIEEKEKILADIKAQNLNDPEVNDLIKKVEASIANEKEEIRKKEEAAKPENVLNRLFDGIAAATSQTEADGFIQQALQMFTTEKSNVLIIVAKGDNYTDYDEPTNITKYLNYLRDTKKSLNKVEKIHYDANQKIKTLELIKK